MWRSRIVIFPILGADLGNTVQTLWVALMDTEVKISLQRGGKGRMPHYLAVQFTVGLHCTWGGTDMWCSLLLKKGKSINQRKAHLAPAAGRIEKRMPPAGTTGLHVNSAARLRWFRMVTELRYPDWARKLGTGRSTSRVVDRSRAKGTTWAWTSIWPGCRWFTE